MVVYSSSITVIVTSVLLLWAALAVAGVAVWFLKRARNPTRHRLRSEQETPGESAFEFGRIWAIFSNVCSHCFQTQNIPGFVILIK